MAARLIQNSFAAGEISPALFARTDLEQYAHGAALLRNVFVDYRGGAASRPGTQMVTQTKLATPPRLIPFIFSTIGAYILEVGAGYIRFIADGAYVISGGVPSEVTTPYAQADLIALKYTQSADVLTITHPSYPIYNLTRTSATTFTFVEDVIGPVIAGPAAITAVQVNGTGAALLYGYVVTAVGPNGEESLATAPALAFGEILNQDTGVINKISWTVVSGASSYNIYKVGPTASGTGNTSTPQGTFFGYIGSSTIPTFTDNNIAPDFSQTPPTFQDPFSPGEIASVDVAGGSGYTDPFYGLTFTGDGTGAEGYVICDPTSGLPTGVVLLSPGKNYTTCTVTDSGPNNAVYTVVLGQSSGTYPAACGYDQQRRLFGGTNNFPETFVASQTGLYDNFNTNPISLATDSITASLASRQVNAIKSFTSTAQGLVILTTGGGFLVNGGSIGAAITPSTITASPQPSSGCNDLPPLVINQNILYCQNRGSVVRDLAFSIYVQSFVGTDRSVLASHLFSGYDLVDWTYAEEPFRLVNLVRNDGIMLLLTYVSEQQIYAWAHYDTNGSFMSVASIPEDNENAIYVVVQRNVGGTLTNFIERFASRLFNEPEDSWCVDCALSLPHYYPDATIILIGVSGHSAADNIPGGFLNVYASAPVWSAGNVGQTLWAGGGWGICTAYISTTQIQIQVIRPFPVTPDDPAGSLEFYLSGNWEIDPNVTTISGLDYLDGLTVTGIADGMPIPPTVVTSGSITLAHPASKVVVGLGYQCQLQTLYLDAGEPTIQGERKQIPAVTVRAYLSSGISIGPTFDALTPMVELISPYPPTLISIDAREPLASEWNKEGQTCIQQDSPLPFNILGIITEVQKGDTQR